MLNVLKKIDKSIEWVQLVMCCIIMFAIMWLTFAMVFWRYALNNSIVWAEEILRYIISWAPVLQQGKISTSVWTYFRAHLRAGPSCAPRIILSLESSFSDS